MMKLRQTGMFALVALLLAACTSEEPEPPEAVGAASASNVNALSLDEEAEGWQMLFDGESLAGWRGLGQEAIPEGHWVVEDGTIHKVPSGDVPLQADGQPMDGGDLMTVDTYENFELVFEWKISEAGNSGVKYNVSEALSTAHDPPNAALGFEYQVLDDQAHPDSEDPTHRAGALYDLYEPSADKVLRPVGEWNTARVVVRGNYGEHWLNGVKVVEYDLGSPEFEQRFQASKYTPIDGFAEKRAGHIVLQDHTDAAWFRNIKIRSLPASQ